MNRVLLHQIVFSRSRRDGFWQSGSSSAVSACVIVLGCSLLALGLGKEAHADRSELNNIECLVEPSMVVELGAAVPGQLAEALFDRGDYVAEGTVMGALESSVEATVVEIATQVATAKTGVELRNLSAAFGYRKLQRNEELLASKSISAQSMDQVKTETKMAELQLKQEQENHALAQLELKRAKATLKRRQIISPIDGTVIRRYRNPGEFVDSDAVFQIAQLDPLHIEALLPISALGEVEVGSNVALKLNVPRLSRERYTGIVRRIDAVADAASATYGVRVELENPDLKIPSGVRCQANFNGS